MSSTRILSALAIVAVAAGLAFLAIKTRPVISGAARTGGAPVSATPLPDPLQVPALRHMVREEHLDAGPPPGHALALSVEGNHVRLTLSEDFLKSLGPGALAMLGLPDATVVLSWSRYLEFLNDLHSMVAQDDHDAREDHAEHGPEPERTPAAQ